MPLAFVHPALTPLGPVLFETGFQVIVRRASRGILWRAVSGEAAFLASTGVGLEEAIPAIIAAAQGRPAPIEEALEAIRGYPASDWQELALAMLTASLAQLRKGPS